MPAIMTSQDGPRTLDLGAGQWNPGVLNGYLRRKGVITGPNGIRWSGDKPSRSARGGGAPKEVFHKFKPLDIHTAKGLLSHAWELSQTA